MLENRRLAMDRFLGSVERRAYRMAEMATQSREEALDIVQDAMVSLVKRYAAKPESEWRLLFYKILQSKIRDWYRRARVRRRWNWFRLLGVEGQDPEGEDPIESLPDEPAADPAERVMMGQFAAALVSALRQLPLRQQQAFLLRGWEGLSVSESASAMGCSEGSVKTHYSRAIHALRNALGEY
jgi:RNA polymerase sigma-70 factor (ECF subfamily)